MRASSSFAAAQSLMAFAFCNSSCTRSASVPASFRPSASADAWDCSSCSAEEFPQYEGAPWYAAYERYSRPLLVDYECIRPDDTLPALPETLCFWLQVGTLLWVALATLFCLKLWEQLPASRRILLNGVNAVAFGLGRLVLPEPVRQALGETLASQRIELVVYAREASEIMQTLTTQGRISLLQAARGLWRKARRAPATIRSILG